MTDEPEDRFFYTKREAAQVLGIGKDSLRSMIEEGQLPIIVVGKREVIRKADVHAFIAGQAS